MVVIICSDRDGTITKDDDFYLGKERKWHEQIELLPGVVSGGKILNSIEHSKLFITTNQSIVAIKDYTDLTEERVHEVNDYVVNMLAEKGVHIEECFCAFHAGKDYFDRYKKEGYKMDKKYLVPDPIYRKPNIGMIEKAAKRCSVPLADAFIYVLGDRATDVECAINAGGKGVLIPTKKTSERGDTKKVEKLLEKYPKRVKIAKNFLDAAKWIAKDAKKEVHQESSE